MMFLFPFNEIEKGSKIVLYGAGVCGKSFYEQCRAINYCEIVLWADKRWNQLNNEYNDYKIQSLQEIREIITEIDYVLIAIENDTIAAEAENQILDAGVPREKIRRNIVHLNDSAKETHFISDVRFNAMQIDSVLPSNYIDIIKKNERLEKVRKGGKKRKYKIRFAISALNNLIGVQTIAKAFAEDDKYDVLMVVWGNPKNLKVELDRLQIPYCYIYDYDIKADLPDISFVTYGGNSTYIKLRKYSKKIVAIHISIVKWSNVSIAHYLKQVKREFNQVNPDLYVWDKLLYDSFKEADILEANYYLVGNPKFDVIYDSLNTTQLLEGNWIKTKNKKVFLWCTDHVFYCENITFDIYAKKIIEIFENNKDICLIFRPHPQLIQELLENCIWSESDLYNFKRYMSFSNNMIWDDNGTYEMAYSLCDAILVDSECGIIVSSLPLDVPIAALMRPEKNGVAHEEIISSLYEVQSVEALENFIQMVIDGRDYKKNDRCPLQQKYINHFDGKNGLRIKELTEDLFINTLS